MLNRLAQLFPLWALLFSLLAYWQPQWLVAGKDAIVPLLMLIMFGMGLSLSWADFQRVLKCPGVIGLGVALQYSLMPLIAWGIGIALQLPEELLVGLILVGACPGGTASNVIAYLARANVALSVAITFASTLLAIIATPLLTWLYLGERIPVPVNGMLLSLVQIVIVPVVAGCALNTFFNRQLTPIRDCFPLVSVAAIVAVIGIIVALNQGRIGEAGLAVFVAVALHNGLGLLGGYGVARLLRLDRQTSRTLAIEVGMQNSGLGVALAIKHFTPLAALPGALFSVWHNLSGSLLATVWQRDASASHPDSNNETHHP
ncbi:MAG: bile acid:sodium symporter [Alcanivorax borkumensis]|jgi:BASS family bile acid:Na+ symporter|uniref:Na+ symporter family protein n=1 Tax=Alcanivorax borkumensis (strain ATCC 700651 / DSM 11573 / NCIMB 13689 / SK2) TaxID=393595 RepID=Q0VLI5_ALCBS|nr:MULTISPECIES: bile acid:sodium symporter family protein [Alcanivorax]OJH06786.1 MAG: bile acid:sodium symporter [Alcanivorax borkumensis]BAP15414.1 Na(+) symporter family protein [Alcanivorax sp. NBRC 101098]CAL17963.1 Na+ symporter family protein [Alcanivorax borkumensis SK2]